MIIAAMQRPAPPTTAKPWLNRLLTTLLAALAAGSAVYWGLTWPTPPGTTRAAISTDSVATVDPDKLARLLGAGQSPIVTEAAAPAVTSNLKLVGIIAVGAGGSAGSALISVAGAPAKPYRVGQTVADDLVLRAVKPRQAELSSKEAGAARVSLELPTPK